LGQTPAPTVLITGRVIDPTERAIPQASIILRPLGTNEKLAETKTDENGNFALPEFPSEAYEVFFQAVAFEPQARRISKTDHGALNIGTVKLWVGYEKPYFLPPNPLAPNTPSTRIQTSLCELLAKPSLFHGKFVEIHATLRSLGTDSTTVFTDANCRADVRLSIADETKPLSEVRKLRQYLSRGQIAVGTIMGKFEIQLILGGVPELRFDLLSASDVTAGSIPR
jgi:hypothetical protein